MTESSDQYKKRQIINAIESVNWTYRISVFFEVSSDCSNAREHFESLRKSLGRGNGVKGFFWKLAIKNVPKYYFEDLKDESGYFTAPFLTLYFVSDSPNGVDNDIARIESWAQRSGLAVSTKSEPWNQEKAKNHTASIRTGMLHDLNRYFKQDKVQRHGWIKKGLIPKDCYA
ncbi:hypothetical protein [uncultured Pseudoteredinibacter sp.]|uniref:hypothetical protein n=1 Tax=uncultured Pseudoteredinibacter sp. TaxID=1641701 RepID=UPI0026354BCE|nr:hypothetical protein [uncultured Pseudoteredinibacter sp.]